MIGALRDHLAARWADLRPGSPPLRGAIVAGADKHPSAKVTFLFFDRWGRQSVAVKVARDGWSERALVAEHEALTHFWSSGSACIATSVPEPLLLERIQGRLALVMSALDGEPMMTRYYRPRHTSDPDRVARDFGMAGEWLRRFQLETQAGRQELTARSYRRWADPILERYRTEIGWGSVEDELFEAVMDRVTALEGCDIPLSGVHGDYWTGNLLVSGDRVAGVIDWELGKPEGLPFADLYKFPTSYGFYLDRAYPAGTARIPGHPGRDRARELWSRFGDWPNLVGFGYGYFGQGWFPDLVRRSVLEHFEYLGVPAAANAVFFPLFLAEQATAIPDRTFRAGYRALLAGFSAERSSGWLWATDGQAASTVKPEPAPQRDRPRGDRPQAVAAAGRGRRW
ncbi:MAG: aminoglycoside phosphotransferase family protein [Actinomycetota bacterium]|nr:aminoglycoside phosphotransferase family protein [Actinomycetota bacterium]